MPFCSQCGNTVGDQDAFCGRCGAQQPGAAGAKGGRDFGPVTTVPPKTASVLCYIPWVGWIIAIIVLASNRFRHDKLVRFHAFQGLYLFVAWLINDRVLRYFVWPFGQYHLHWLISAALTITAIFMIVKTSQDKRFSLPLFGELAERSVAEN